MIQKPVNISWSAFESKTSEAFKDLWSSKNFTGVTLATEDDHQIDAHKIILSTSSPFFKNIFEKNPHQKPLLYLKDVSYPELRKILDYIYLGECELNSDILSRFLSVGETLQIHGLTEQTLVPEERNVFKESLDAHLPKLKEDSFVHVPEDFEGPSDTRRNKALDTYVPNIESQFDDFDSSMVSKVGYNGQVLCNVCNFVTADELIMKHHITTHNIRPNDVAPLKAENKSELGFEKVVQFKTKLNSDKISINLDSDNWNIQDRASKLKEFDDQIVSDRQLIKRLKSYLDEKKRPFLGLFRRQGEVIMCGDKGTMTRVKKDSAMEKAIKDMFLEDLEKEDEVQEFVTDEQIFLPPLFCPFRNFSKGWAAKFVEKTALLYLHILDVQGRTGRQDRRQMAPPGWWPKNLAFQNSFQPCHASKEDNENIIISIFNYFSLDINTYHL